MSLVEEMRWAARNIPFIEGSMEANRYAQIMIDGGKRIEWLEHEIALLRGGDNADARP